MRRPATGLPVSLVLLALTGCDRLFGLEHVEIVEEEEHFDNGYTCDCTCTYPDGGVSVIGLDVCMPPEINPNITGTVPGAAALVDDCGGRVQSQIGEMTDECWDGQDPVCDCVAATTTFYHDRCDDGCPEVPIDDTCSNWDPENGVGSATCGDQVDCDDYGPVCVRPVSDTGNFAPTPLSARIMGRSTTCTVTGGDLTLGVGDDTESVPLSGVVTFAPAAGCDPGDTCLTMDYRFATTGTMSFGGIPILGIGDTDISGVVSAGGTAPFALGESGTSFLAAASVGVAGRAFENGDRFAAVGTNVEPLVVSFDGDGCTVQGNLAGGVGDPDGDSDDATVHVFATGTVDNSPPVADVDVTPILECTSPDGAEVVVDASPSADREDNVVSYGWYLGSRVGPLLALGPVLTTQQPLGSQTYVLKLVDAGMQSDELDVTVSVVDTTAPVLDCGAPATITPDAAPYSFRATAADTCDDGLGAAEVLDVECFKQNGAGRRVDVPCHADIDGDTLGVAPTGGVGTVVRWSIRATDASGNGTTTGCETVVVVPGDGG